MRSKLMKIVGLAAATWASASVAAPINQYTFDIRATATVISTEVGGRVYQARFQDGDWVEGDTVRSLSENDFDRLAWNVGDRLSVRWRLGPNSDYDQSCVAEAGGWLSFSGFGGATPAVGCAGPAAISAELRRADGSRLSDFETADASDGLGPYEFGPSVNLLTGEYQLAYGNPDGHLVTVDCCSYSYDAETDSVLSAAGPGEWFTFYFGRRLAGAGLGFSEDSGGGLYSNSTFEFEDESYQVDMSNFFRFDVDWDVRVRRVPEPGNILLVGLGLLGVAVRRRRSLAVT